ADIANPQSLNKYHYCYNNPLRYVDPNGHEGIGDYLKSAANAVSNSAVGDTVRGAVNAFNENNGLPAPGGNQNSLGRGIGHAFSLIQATTEIVTGGTAFVGGTAEAVLTAPTVVAAVPGAAVAVAGGAVAAHGAAVFGSTANNIYNSSNSSNSSGGGIANTGGRYGDLRKLAGPDENAHHVPQKGAKITPEIDGPAVGMTRADHSQTRTYKGRGREALKTDAHLTPRQRLAKDIRDLRTLFGSKYRKGSMEAIKYARQRPEFKK
ncbi:MAG: hypothetical protein AB1489_43410, partial [Acidobacteriota bacterium]